MRARLTFANVTSVFALAVALGGTGAYAAGLVTSGDIKNGTVKSVDIKNRTIKQKDVRPGGLGSAAIRDGSITRADLADAVLTDVERVSGSSVANSEETRNAIVYCPSGKHVIGGFASARYGVALLAISEYPQGSSFPTSLTAAAQEIYPISQNWSLKATAVCARFTPAG
jgi:hypothetical protein